jgi:glycosyltransferase involved in cell wall biosynthesis
MTLATIISTYQRPDGKTPFYLDRTLTCIDNQTHTDHVTYVIGDAYQNYDELRAICDKHKDVICINLDKSPERERYGFGNMKIWCAGGVTAVNTGIAMALEDGCEYICHQGHDDLWENNHLETINKIIEQYQPIFCCTLSTYGQAILPPFPVTNEILPYFPIDGGMIASTACIRYSETKLRVMDRFHVEGIVSPCDAYLWEQLRNEMIATGKKGYVATTVTAHHDEEGYAMQTNQVQRHEKSTHHHRRRV